MAVWYIFSQTFISYEQIFVLSRHNKNKRKRKKDKVSDDDVSTVLEEDEEEEAGDGDSTDNGIDTLLDNVEGLLESRDRAMPANSTTAAVTTGCKQAKVAPRSGEQVFGALKKMDAPKELYDATALLLQSSLLDDDTAMLLTRDIMELSVNDDADATANKNSGFIIPDAVQNATIPNEQHDVSNISSTREETKSEDVHQDETNDETKPSETTALLKNVSTENEEMLKPSIWNMQTSSTTCEQAE